MAEWTDGDILDPEDYMEYGWCDTVDCVSTQYADQISYEVYAANIATGKWCSVGGHTGILYASANVSLGEDFDNIPTCDDIMNGISPLLQIPSTDIYYQRGPDIMYVKSGFIKIGCNGYSIGNGYYADNPCGQYNDLLPNPEWVSGTPGNWRGKGIITCTITELIKKTEVIVCPPNSYYENGTCTPNPGYVPNEKCFGLTCEECTYECFVPTIDVLCKSFIESELIDCYHGEPPFTCFAYGQDY